jgi:hypothetical protein
MTEKRTVADVILPFAARADPFTYVVFGAISGIFLLPSIVMLALGKYDWLLFAFSTGSVVLIMGWVACFKIVLTDDGVIYRCLFGGSRFLPYNAIKEARIDVGLSNRKPTYALVLTADPSAHHKTLVINLKIFSRDSLSQIMNMIAYKAPNAHLDKRCQKMKERIMPSLFEE